MVPSCVVNSSRTLRASCLSVGLDATNSLRVLKPADILNNNNLNTVVQEIETARKGLNARLTVLRPHTNLLVDS